MGGYYQIAVTGNLTYTGDGNTYTDPGPTVVKYEYVTAVSVGIVWNGDPTDLLSATGAGIGSGTDITGQTVKTVVGAQVPLATAILPSDLIVSDTNWTIPGFSMPQGYAFSTISENPNSWWNSVTIMPAGCTFFAELRLMDLYSSPITFYWSQPAAAGNQMVSVSVVVQSGTGAGARSLTFDPSVTFVLEEPTPHVSPTFDQMYVDANYNDVADGRVYTGTWLHFGMDDGGPWGVEMHEKFDDAPDFASNAANWVQVFRQSQWGYHIVTGRFHPNKWVHAVPTVTVAPLLDSYYPLPTYSYPGGSGFADIPGMPVDIPFTAGHTDACYMYLEFTSYYLYTPVGNHALPVPMYYVQWHCGGVARRLKAGVWSLLSPFKGPEGSGAASGMYEWQGNVQPFSWVDD